MHHHIKHWKIGMFCTELMCLTNSVCLSTTLKLKVYGPSVSAGGYASVRADDRPELRKYYVGEFTRKMKLSLHCITSQVNL